MSEIISLILSSMFIVFVGLGSIIVLFLVLYLTKSVVDLYLETTSKDSKFSCLVFFLAVMLLLVVICSFSIEVF